MITIGDGFLYFNKELLSIELLKVKIIGKEFLKSNRVLEKVELPNVVIIGDGFLYFNEELLSIELPNVVKIGFACLRHNEKLQSIVFPKLKVYSEEFCKACNHLVYVYTPLLPELEAELYSRSTIEEKKLC